MVIIRVANTLPLSMALEYIHTLHADFKWISANFIDIVFPFYTVWLFFLFFSVIFVFLLFAVLIRLILLLFFFLSSCVVNIQKIFAFRFTLILHKLSINIDKKSIYVDPLDGIFEIDNNVSHNMIRRINRKYYKKKSS